MQFSGAEIAEAVGAGSDARESLSQVVIGGVSIDSRSIRPGDLFVPVVAERDGHDFVASAVAAGAAAYLSSRAEVEVAGAARIMVGDTTRALGEIGRRARDRHTGPVIGITGSVGKTSVKDLTAAAVSGGARVHANPSSFNNEWGVPLTLANAPDDSQVLVVEMGARGIGHIAELCELARPTIGVVTWVGAAHTSEFGSIEAVAEAKAELVKALDREGTAVLNADCGPVAAMAQATAARVVTYGVETPADFGAADVVIDADLRPSFVGLVAGQKVRVRLGVHGAHQVSNALAALAAAQAAGVDLDAAAGGLAGAEMSRWRMELARTPGGAVIINDAYNANAISTAAALRSLAAVDAGRRVAVLGHMAELGDRHESDHQAMAVLCDRLGIELIAYDEPAYGPEPASDFDQVRGLLGVLGAGDAVLVKASRVAGLERLAELLVAE